MCGIITVIKKKEDGIPTSTTISGMLTQQISRGSEGFGYLGFGDVVESYVRRETRPEIESVLEKSKSRSIMFHHRFPTSTPNYADCTHPIKVSHEELKHDWYLVHNGMISNDTMLHKKHLELGYEYETTCRKTISTKNFESVKEQFNDSEALAIDIARYLEEKQPTIESRGSIAFVMARCKKGSHEIDAVFFGRNSSPLTISHTGNSLVLRSEGEKDFVEANKLFCLNMKTFKVSSIDCQIGEILSQRYGNYGTSDEDEDYRYGHSENRYFGGTVSKPYGRERVIDIGAKDIDTTASSEEDAIVEGFVQEEIIKHEEMLDYLEERLVILHEDMEWFKEHRPDDTESMAELEREITKVEEDLDKFETDLDLLLSGEFDDAVASKA